MEMEQMGLSKNQAITLYGSMLMIKRYMVEERTKGVIIRSPEDAADYVMQDMRNLNQEHLVALFLNTKNEIIDRKTIFIGSLNASIVHPRELYREAIKRSSASLIGVHIGMKNQWRNYNLLYPQCYINFAFFLMAKLSLKVGWR